MNHFCEMTSHELSFDDLFDVDAYFNSPDDRLLPTDDASVKSSEGSLSASYNSLSSVDLQGYPSPLQSPIRADQAFLSCEHSLEGTSLLTHLRTQIAIYQLQASTIPSLQSEAYASLIHTVHEGSIPQIELPIAIRKPKSDLTEAEYKQQRKRLNTLSARKRRAEKKQEKLKLQADIAASKNQLGLLRYFINSTM